MRTDRELLELAAKAAGMTGLEYTDHFLGDYYDPRGGEIGLSGTDTISIWNPLINDGDALRLMASLRLVVHVWHDDDQVSAAKTLPGGDDPPSSGEAWHCATAHAQGSIEAATRRAIVLAAAEIGASIP